MHNAAVNPSDRAAPLRFHAVTVQQLLELLASTAPRADEQPPSRVALNTFLPRVGNILRNLTALPPPDRAGEL